MIPIFFFDHHSKKAQPLLPYFTFQILKNLQTEISYFRFSGGGVIVYRPKKIQFLKRFRDHTNIRPDIMISGGEYEVYTSWLNAYTAPIVHQ